MRLRILFNILISCSFVLVSYSLFHVLDWVLGPLVNGVLAITAFGLEMWEALLKGQPKYVNVDQVAELLANQPEEVPKNEGRE